MDKDLRTLHGVDMATLMQGTKHGRFFTQAEYEVRRGKIDVVYSATNKLNTKLTAVNAAL